jgi:hypothetical protein
MVVAVVLQADEVCVCAARSCESPCVECSAPERIAEGVQVRRDLLRIDPRHGLHRLAKVRTDPLDLVLSQAEFHRECREVAPILRPSALLCVRLLPDRPVRLDFVDECRPLAANVAVARIPILHALDPIQCSCPSTPFDCGPR